MEDFKELIVGGIIVVLIGGTTFAVSQTDVLDTFGKETGMSEQEVQQYSEDIEEASFTEIGNDLLVESAASLEEANYYDCENYTYEWENESLTCQQGKQQLVQTSTNEKLLGDCYIDLDKDLGDGANARIKECIRYVDAVNGSYDYPINTYLYGAELMDELKTGNLYNKSVLVTALEAS